MKLEKEFQILSEIEGEKNGLGYGKAEYKWPALSAILKGICERQAEAGCVEAVLVLIQADPHQWQKRPCPTCSKISNIVNRPFGCNTKNGDLRL